MPQPKKTTRTTAAARKPAARRRSLPPLSVAHFEEAMRLVEALVEEQTDVFVAAGQRYRERHREGTERRLTAQEAAQIASAMASAEGLPPVAVAVAVQESDLRGYEEPEPREILLAAGVATAPAAIGAVKRFVALIEMTTADLEAAHDLGRLEEELDERVKAMTYASLDGPDGMRDRASAAWLHFAQAAGSSTGKALGLLLQAWLQALEQSMTSLGFQRASSSLTGSPPDTTGLGETSSTAPPTATP